MRPRASVVSDTDLIVDKDATLSFQREISQCYRVDYLTLDMREFLDETRIFVVKKGGYKLQQRWDVAKIATLFDRWMFDVKGSPVQLIL